MKTVVKKGKPKTKKPKVKKTEPAKPIKDYNYGINSSESESTDEEYESRLRTTNINSDVIGLGDSFLDDKKAGGPKYLETNEKDRKDIKKYLLKNKVMKNPVVRAAEIDDLLFRNLRGRKSSAMNSFQKLLNTLYMPIFYLTYVTVLPTTNRQYSKLRYLCFPLIGGTFIFYIFTNGQSSILTYLIAVIATGVVATLGLFTVLKKDEPPTGVVKKALVFLGFFSSVCWLWFLSDLLVSMIKTLHVIFNYHYVFMMIAAFSFLAWVPMSLGSLKIVRLLQHMPGYSGVVFNGLFVFGLSTIIQTVMFGSQSVEMFPRVKGPAAMHVFGYIVCIIFTCVLTYFLLQNRDWKYTQFLGLSLALLYNVAIFYTFIEGLLVG